MKCFFKESRKSRRYLSADRSRSLQFEQMESRQLMTVSSLLNAVNTGILNTGTAINAPPTSGPTAEGSITFNSSTGVVSIDASQTHNDTVTIYINHREGPGTGNIPDLLTVSLANINTPLVETFDPSTVTKIVFTSHGGNDYVNDQTSVMLVAYGGTGSDTFLGGTGGDLLVGGTGNNYLDGRGGGDMLFGGAGTNVMFGDDGIDSLYGGSGTNYMFGGNGNDYLYAGTGTNWMYGEAGTDSIISKSAADHIYADYGPTANVSNNGCQGFDFFDRYLTDPSVRSMARYDYFKDGALTRNDMLGIYTQIATDGVQSTLPYDGTVSANELANLKTLTNTKLNIDDATRYLANQIANGNPANAHYQGATLGNLAAGQDGNHLNELVDKWFEGLDLPAIGSVTSGYTVQYGQVSGSLFGTSGPQYTDVAQGFVGDCYFMSALGELALQSPQTIRNMFVNNGDGTYTVKFYHNGTAAYVTVNSELPLDMNNNGTAWFADWGSPTTHGVRNLATNVNNILWVALAEKAYAQLDESGWIGQAGTNTYQGINDGSSTVAFAQLTGQSASSTSVTASNSQKNMLNTFGAGKPVTLATKTSGTDSDIVADHVYMVINVDTNSREVEIYNPAGYDDTGTTQPATMWVSWTTIEHNFTGWATGSV